MKIFYGVYLEDERLSACLDLVRLISEPDYYRRCHLTIRGPYERRIPDKRLLEFNKTLNEAHNTINFIGVGSFFIGRQSTVILDCEITGIRDIWHKPDFQDGKPHITLYDGNSIEFARVVKFIASKIDWNFSSKISKLSMIERKSDMSEFLDIYYRDVFKFAEKLFGTTFNVRRAYTLDSLDKVVLLEKVVNYIDCNYTR